MMPPRGPRRLLGGGCDHVGEGNRVGIHPRGDQTGIVGHVDHEDRADVLGDLGKSLEVDAQGIGRGAGDDQLGLGLMGLALHGVVVDLFLVIEAVGDDVEPLAAHVQGHAVGEVAAFGQAHAHDGVAGLEEGQKHGFVGGGAAVRLHVGRVGAEQLLDAFNGQALGHVHIFAAAVVALAGVAFGVLVGQLGALGRHHGGRGVVLAGNQFDVLFLAAVLGLDRGEQFGVGLLDEDVAVVHGSPDRRWSLFINKGCPGERLDATPSRCQPACGGTLPRGDPRRRRQPAGHHGPGRRAYRQSRTGLV